MVEIYTKAEFVVLFDMGVDNSGSPIKCGFFRLENKPSKNTYLCVPYGESKEVYCASDLLLEEFDKNRNFDKDMSFEMCSEGFEVKMHLPETSFKISKNDIEALRELDAYWNSE